MNDNQNKTKYDSSFDDAYHFYDSFPYERNLEVCGNDCVRMYSGNVVKQHSCNLIGTVVISNQDEKIAELIRHQMENCAQEESC